MSAIDKVILTAIGIAIFCVGLATVITFIAEVIVTAVEHWKKD